MRNLRKLTAAVLSVALVLTSMTAAFAAETATTPVNGDKAITLNQLGLYAGIDKDTFNPDLEASLTRQQATVLLLKMFGLADKAAALTDEDVATALKGYTDADKVASWAKKEVAYAVTNKIMSGTSDTTIDPAAKITGAQYATLIVKSMGYDVADYKVAVTQLSKVTGSKVADEFAEADLIRDNAVGYMYGALTAQTKDGKTVIANLVAANPAIADKAIAAGLYTVANTTLTVDSVVAVANNKVKVELKEAADASAADFAIVKKGTTTTVEIKNVAKESDKLYILETEALVKGTMYTLTANAKSVNFTGIAADTSAPTVSKVAGKDYNKFEVEFSDKMDSATAADIANYTFDKSVKVVKAELNGDRNKVTLFTDAAKKNIVYTITIQNVTNSDGKAMAKTSRTVTAQEDKVVPKLTNLKVQNNHMLVVTILDNSGLDKTSAETLANYSINDLEILSAKAYDIDDDASDNLETVVLTTAEQVAGKQYTLTVQNVTDTAVLANPIAKTTRTFRGASADKTAPTVVASSIKSENNNTVFVEFNEINAMDTASLEDISNYTITYGNNGDTLEIISAKAAYTSYPDMYNKATKKVTLTTAAQEVNAQYKIEVKGVQDEFGNALKTKSGSTAYTTYPFKGTAVKTVPPTVTKVEYVSDTRVNLTFSDNLKESIAEDPTNYSFDNEIGAPIKANLKDDKIVELTVPALTNNKTYKVTVNNVEDSYGNACQNVTVKVTATSKDLDNTAPSINYIQASSKTEILVNLDESVGTYPSTITVSQYDETKTPAVAVGTPVTFTKVGRQDDGKTVAYYSSTPLVTYVDYKIQSTVGNFVDDAGNALVVSSKAVADRNAFQAADNSNETPKVDWVEQINVKKLKVTFTEPVLVPKKSSDDNDFASQFKQVNKDDADDYMSNEWYFVYNSKLPVDKDITINFSAAVDGNYTNVSDTAYKFRANMEDSTKPSISSVVAENNHKIVVTYDEDLDLPGSYKLLVYNPTTGKKDILETRLGSCDKEDSTVEIATTNRLSSANTYYLVVVSGATDVAGNKESASTTEYEFIGSDVVVSNFVTGVSINKANEIKVSATANLASAVVTTDVATSGAAITATVGSISGQDADNLTIAINGAVLSGATYKVSVVYKNGATEDYFFSGNTPDMNLGLTYANGTTTLDFVQAELDSYTFAASAVNSDGTVSAPVAGVAANGAVTFAGMLKEQIYIVTATKNDSGTIAYAQVVTVK